MADIFESHRAQARLDRGADEFPEQRSFSSSSVCGLGTLTSAISSSLARSREMRASSSALMAPYPSDHARADGSQMPRPSSSARR